MKNINLKKEKRIQYLLLYFNNFKDEIEKEKETSFPLTNHKI